MLSLRAGLQSSGLSAAQAGLAWAAQLLASAAAQRALVAERS